MSVAAEQPSSAGGRKVGVLAGVRAFAVMLGGSIVLDAAAAASIVSTARALVRGHVPRPLAAAGTAATVAYALAARPWLLRWGATAQELSKPLPGDELVPDPGIVTTRAVTIDAPAGEVWPWLAQLGQDRGGFYSYEWLENLAGCEMHNAERIHSEWQHRDIGETLFLHPATGLQVTRFEPGRALGIEGWGTLVLEPAGDERTRLIVRGRGKRSAAAILYSALLLEIPHFLMERRMLLGIKERAERARRVAP